MKNYDHSLSALFDLKEAMTQTTTCPVCQLVSAKLLRYIDAINYEAVNESDLRHAFDNAGGFCHDHAWLWQRHAFLLATASLYHEALDYLPEPGSRSVSSPHLGRWFGTDHQPDTHRCPLCRWTLATEKQLVDAVLQGLDDDAFADLYASHAGLCRPHLTLVMHEDMPSQLRQALMDQSRVTEDRLKAQLAEIIHKHDYRYSHEPVGDEVGAAERIIAHLVGGRDVILGR